ncbi:MAG: TAXI family TRAP transporter solute-binding subunit [Proteobacteria bacterium]|nr:TAXI family TRAP transporter solute-binding subunit [Pseudomonadota bacterium]
MIGSKLPHALCIGAAVLATGVCAQAQAPSVRFAAGQQGSQNYGVNAALAQAFKTDANLNTTVQAFGGPTAYLPLVNSGELDVAAVVMPDLGDAIRGAGPFSGNAQKNLRLVAALFASPVGLMVRKDSGIASIRDLKGKRVSWGLTAQASLLPYVEGALANGGLTRNDVKLVPVASVANGVDDLVAGRVDATLFALRGGKVVEADSASGGIRWLPFDTSAPALARMQAIAPEAYLATVTPADKVVGASTPMSTMAYDYVLVTGPKTADAAITAMAMTLREKGAEIAKANKVLGTMTAQSIARPYKQVPHHPAASAVLGIKN